MSAHMSHFYIATWHEGRFGTADSKVFTDIASAHQFFIDALAKTFGSEKDTFVEASHEVRMELLQEVEDQFGMIYDHFECALVRTTHEEFGKRALTLLSQIGHTLYM